MASVQLNISNAVATITLNRPEERNALNAALADELVDVTETVMRDDRIRAVVLNGAGRMFCAGGDIDFFHERLADMPEGVRRIVRQVNAAVFNLKNMPKPVLASVHGAVAGVGLGFMLAADLVIAANNTKLTTAYSHLGLSPDGGVSYFLPRLIGEKKALALLFSSEYFNAETAYAYGLVNYLAAPEALAAETECLVQKLAAGPTRAYAHIKKLVRNSFDHGLAEQLEQEAESFTALSGSQDFCEGVKAFVARRKPEFSGQ